MGFSDGFVRILANNLTVSDFDVLCYRMAILACSWFVGRLAMDLGNSRCADACSTITHLNARVAP